MSGHFSRRSFIGGAALASSPIFAKALAARPPATLKDLLENNRSYDAEHSGGLANHLSMALIAIARLGGSEMRLREYFDRYAKRLEPRRARSTAMTEKNWIEHRGVSARCPDFLAFFSAESARLGPKQFLAQYLPPLASGISGALFHPAIRLAYALEAADTEDAIVSLAYLAATHLAFPFTDRARASESPRSPLDALRGISKLPEIAKATPQKGTRNERLRATYALPGLSAIAGAPLPERALEEIARAAVHLYASTGDFGALHTVTGAQAARVISEHVPEAKPTIDRAMFQGLLVVHASIGAPALLDDAAASALAATDSPSWERIGKAAIASDDEHNIKIAYSCREEERATGSRLHRVVAARRLGLIT